ncbi:MAG: DNA polymerase IV [Gammaproteobacteria bacterium]
MTAVSTASATASCNSGRRIIHLDMDAFYASVEQRDNPALRGRPVAVGGPPESRGVVAAASYEARVFGIHSAMPTARALRQCPDLVVIRPDFGRYREASRQVMEILRSATALVEPLSLDEAYLDVTENHWGQPLATEIAKELKQRIRSELSLTASAGVAPNKFLAKIASGWQKPDGLTVVSPERVERFLQQLPVEALWGVGPVTARKLRSIGIRRLVEIRTVDPAQLTATVGSLSETLRRLAIGDDPRDVNPDRPRKSISAESTYPSDLSDPATIAMELSKLAERVAASLQQKVLAAKSVAIKVRFADFSTVTRSHTGAMPTADAAEIVWRAVALLGRTQASSRPVRLLGVGAHGLVDNHSHY